MRSTAFFTLEMADIELADRLIGSETGLSSGKRKGKDKMEDYEWKMLEQALAKGKYRVKPPKFQPPNLYRRPVAVYCATTFLSRYTANP